MTSTPLLRWSAVMTAAFLVAGCASTPLAEDPAPTTAPTTEATTAPTAGSGPSASTATATSATARAVDPLTDPKSPLAKREIFFDFDSFEIRAEFLPVLEAHGKYLAANPGRQIVIEGNADDRGSREYNLAIGQKRADAVRSRLQLLGVSASRIETVSFGEERPRATGADEASWAQNRRADIVYR